MYQKRSTKAGKLVLSAIVLLAIGIPVGIVFADSPHTASLSIAPDGMSFTWDGPPAVSWYEVVFCDGTTTGKIETPGAADDETFSFDREIASVTGKGGRQVLSATHTCGQEPPPVCEDEAASNYGQEGECEYPPPPVCEDENALNYGEEGACEYPPPPVCEWERVRFQCRFEDDSAPAGLNPDCWVYSLDGRAPSLGDANRVCTLSCLGLEYTADRRVDSTCGWVERNTCTGEVRYGDQLWMEGLVTWGFMPWGEVCETERDCLE